MSRLAYDAYLDHLRRESRRFRDVLAATDPAARVPSCPEWDAADLLWHLAEVQWFWSQVVLRRPEGPEGLEEPARPESYPDLLAAFDTHSAALVGALETAAPTEPAWTWSAEQTVGFTFRRQAHEALIHRVDAELAAGDVTPLDPALATDGVVEALDVMFGGCPPWGTFTPDGTLLRVRVTDTDRDVLVALGRFTGTDPDSGTAYDEDDLSVVDGGTGEPVATVSGTAGDLDGWLWHRADDDVVRVEGDRGAYERFRAVVAQPIN